MNAPFRFFLGTHHPSWLQYTDVPLFISENQLGRMVRLPEARGLWALDSGGFTRLSQDGSWDRGLSPREYVAKVRRYRDEVGNLAWAAPQDWMCEPQIVEKTGLSVAEHQRRTVANYLELKSIDDTAPVIPVLQGWTLPDYERCVALYERAGVDLAAEATVGIGSVCRRQASSEAASLVWAMARHGVRLHGFGFKIDGLREVAHLFASADSMAWSAAGRREPDGCDYRSPGGRADRPHRSEANCLRYALRWREQVLAACSTQQLTFAA